MRRELLKGRGGEGMRRRSYEKRRYERGVSMLHRESLNCPREEKNLLCLVRSFKSGKMKEESHDKKWASGKIVHLDFLVSFIPTRIILCEYYEQFELVPI